jgi:hypothetical protein
MMKATPVSMHYHEAKQDASLEMNNTFQQGSGFQYFLPQRKQRTIIYVLLYL